MNIWAWVHDKQSELRERGQHRLATIISELPTAVCDMRHEQAEAMVPEGLALAQDLEEPWVEIFLRHWLMQSRVLHRYQGRDNLEACVSLLEFSHRPGNRTCPQSTCVVQDFANCYGVTDGPGYAQERLSVTQEALSRIDPSWPCFECISLERAGALRDARRLDDAIAFIDEQLQAATAADVARSHDKMFKSKAHCLVLLGRGEDALKLLRDAPPSPASGESGQVGYAIAMAEALCAAGKLDEAAGHLPEIGAIDDSDGRDWLAVAEQLLEAGTVDDDARIARAAARVVHRFEANGALWSTAETALMAARIAARRGRRAQADALLDLADRTAQELKAPGGLEEAFERTRALLERTPAAVLPGSVADVDTLAAALPEDLEEALELACAAKERWPDAQSVAVVEGNLLARVGLSSAARFRLNAFVQGHPDAREAARTLGKVLREANDHEALEALVRERFGDDDAVGHWLLATSHERAGRLTRAIDGFQAVLALDPDADPARLRLCDIAIEERRWDDALALAEALCERLEPGPHDWDRIVAATALGRWAQVRASAIRLGMEVEPGDAPIAQIWGRAWIRTSAQRYLWATRTGPVTARIESITGPREDRERQDELVLFDPAPVDREQDGERTIYTYRELVVLEPGTRRSFTIDGVHPGDDALLGLVEELAPVGLRLQRRSGDAYRVTPGDAEGPVPGVYLFASVDADADLPDVHARLAQAVQSWPGPVVWLELCELLATEQAATFDAELKRQRDLAEQLGV